MNGAMCMKGATTSWHWHAADLLISGLVLEDPLQRISIFRISAEYPGSTLLGTKCKQEFSGVASVSAAHRVTYFAIPSALKVLEVSAAAPLGTQSSGCLSLWGEKPFVCVGRTRKATTSIHRLLPVASRMISCASLAMTQASSYMAMKVGGQPWRSSSKMPSASCDTCTDQCTWEGCRDAKPSSRIPALTSRQASAAVGAFCSSLSSGFGAEQLGDSWSKRDAQFQTVG